MEKILTVGKVIMMPCMRQGLCKYPNETILVSKDALEKLAPTMQGVPVVIDHPDDMITEENIASLPVVGRVADMHFNQEDGNWYAHFVVEDAKAVDLLKGGYGVSTAWIGTKYAGSGTFNNVPYDRELLEGRYEHLAIVQNPRYEMSFNPIFKNSKDGQINQKADNIKTDIKLRSLSMFGKLFKKVTQKEEIMLNEGESYIVEQDGKEIDLSEAIKKNSDDKEIELEIDGEKMSLNKLVEAYKELKAASLKADEEKAENKDEEKGEEKPEEKAENEDEEKPEVKEEKKENSLSGDELENALSNFKTLDELHQNGVVESPVEWLSLADRVSLGRKKYGSK